MSSTSSNTEEFTYNELMEQCVKATRLIEHLKSQRNGSKRAFDKAMDLVLKYDARIAELEGKIDQLTAHSDIERQDDKSSNDTQTQTIVYGKEDSEVKE